MANPNQILQAGSGRVWLQRGAPGTPFELLSTYGAGQVQRPRATPTPYYSPDPARRNNWIIVGETTQPPGLVTTTLETVFRSVASVLLALDCPFQLQFRYGLCDRPDIPSAWDKLLHFPSSRVGNYTLNPNIARDPTNQAQMVEAGDITASTVLEVLKLAVSRVSVSELQNAMSIAVSRNAQCAGICGPAIEICDEIYVGVRSASYGTANLLRSANGGATFAATAADPFATNLEISALIAIGGRIIAISDSNTPTIAYSDDDGATWTTVISAVGGVGDLNDGYAVGFNAIYFVGDGGYIFKSEDGGATLSVLSAGAATAQNLNKVKVLQSLTGFAVGNADVILKTTDGESWTLLSTNTGSGANLISLEVIDENRLYVGTVGGELYYSDDGGVTWTERSFSGNGAGAVRDIKFVPDTDGEFGAMIHDTAAPVGHIFRTVDGGLTWDKSLTVGHGSLGSTPTNAGLNALAACGVNSLFAVGNASGGTAVIFKGE